MTNREQQILKLISKNPAISQKEIAKSLGITRSSVGVHITNLIKKGYIAGKGYILSQPEYISIVGGSNIDIIGFPNNNLIPHDSNPGRVKISLGGVGRNIAENAVRLGISTKLISALGEDLYGKRTLDHATSIGLDMSESIIFPQMNTSTYMAILDEKGDMEVAISHMDIYDAISIEFIQQKLHIIENSKLCIIDTNIPKDVIYYILQNCKNTDFFLDTVSTTKAEKVRDVIGNFHTIKPNKIEAELLSGTKINNQSDLINVSEYFLEKGVKKVYITLGEDGVFYNDGAHYNLLPSPKIELINATGAGDAFTAALAYGHFNSFTTDKCTKFAMAASILTLQHQDTINPNISLDNINKIMKEYGLC